MRKRGARFFMAGLALTVGLLGAVGLVAVAGRRGKPAPPSPVSDVAGANRAVATALPPAPAPTAPRRAPPADGGSGGSGAPGAAAVSVEETVLMARLRSVASSDYALAVELARAGNRRFPDSADAPERTSLLIHALANLGRSGEARGEAENMVNHYPDSAWVREVEKFTGAHRHRNVRINDAGAVEFE